MIINSQLGGKTPTGTKSITANGVYDITDFASADVQVPTTAPAHYIEKTKDANNVLQNGSTTAINLTGITDVGGYVLIYAYYGDTSLTGSVNLSSLTVISGQQACFNTFSGCTGITGVDLSNLTTISGQQACFNTFSGCTGITSVDLSSLTTISANNACTNMFYGSTGITGALNLSSLNTVSGSNGCNSMFRYTPITSVDISSLTTVTGSSALQLMFANCTSLTSLSFPALTSTSFGSYTNQFYNMVYGVTGCTVHFPSNLQSVIGSWSDVTAGFGGTNTTVLFDLPATA